MKDDELRQKYLCLLNDDNALDGDGQPITTEYDRWRELKRMVILHGLPVDESRPTGMSLTESHQVDKISESPELSDSASSETNVEEEDKCSLRGRIWKVLLGVQNREDDDHYTTLTQIGPSSFNCDIRNDTFRTFRGDPEFAQRVPEEKLARLLNAFINQLEANPDDDMACLPENGDLDSIRYIQGMNVLCAPFLYVMPEADAFHSFCNLIARHCPLYVAPQLRGVENGCALVDKCLQTLDVELYHHLSVRGITARIYALPLILSLFACVPPLQELLRVWDVLFAVGVHFVVVLAVARTILLRDELLKKNMDLMKILSLRSTPQLQADQLISVALQLMHCLPDDLLYEIARHPFAKPDIRASLPLSDELLSSVKDKLSRKDVPDRTVDGAIKARLAASGASGSPRATSSPRSISPRGTLSPNGTSRVRKTFQTSSRTENRPPWKL